jgi:GDPmannose 4,6-dehydratase
MGHSIVDFYRTTYGLPFSNGVIFTTESCRKKPVFLLNKVVNHIKDWLSGIRETLVLGDLNSSRNILHASDVATAIKTIVSQDHGENYLICNEENVLIYDLVLSLYKKSGILLEMRDDNTLCDKDGNCVVQIMVDGRLSFDDKPIHLRGHPIKLRQLGWNPFVSIDQILDEIINLHIRL